MNIDETRNWLDIVYGDTPGLVHVSSAGNWAGRCFDDTNDALAYIQKLEAGEPEGVYLRATTLRSAPESGRGGDNLSFYLPGLWADVDIAGPGHKTDQQLPPDVESAMRIVAESGLPAPSHWIHSGGGLYPWWLLKDPAEISDIEEFRALSSTWQKILEASAAKLGWFYGAGVGDLSRILRVPGTINRKAGLQRPCGGLEGHSWNGPLYTLQELFDAMAEAAPAPPVPTRVELKISQISGDRPGDDFNNRTQWADVLPGWTWVYKRGDKWHLRRPGKTSGTSATLSLTTDRLYPFTDAAHPLQPWTHYSKFEVFAHTEHHGDFAAAARSLRALGYGAPAAGSMAPPVPATALAKVDWADAAIDAATETPIQGTAVATRDPSWRYDWVKPTVTGNAMVARKATNLDAGDMYAAAYEESFKYCGELGKWHFFSGKAWTEDLKERYEQGGKHLLAQAIQAAEEHKVEEWMKWSRTAARAASPAAIARWARTDPRIAVQLSDFDRHRHLITLDNGIYDLDTDTFTAGHDPKLLLTKLVPVAYDKDAAAPDWEQFLQTVLPDEAIRGYLQRAIGHTLLGDAQERALFLLHGESGTGKSQVIKVFEQLFGDFAETADPTTFNEQSKRATISNGLNDLRGKRFVSLSELEEGEKLNESLVKRLTGGDTAKSRGLYQENRQWQVQFTLWMATNYLPKLNSDDAAMWRRVKPIKFPTVIAEQGKEIKRYGEKLFAKESAGILNWVLQGVRMYLADGLDDLEQITEAVTQYRRDVDTVAQFVEAAVEENLVVKEPAQQMPSRNLHAMYRAWCERNGIRPMGERRFGQRMESLGFERKKTSTSNVWLGVGTGSYGMLGTMAMRQ
jgi:P4 family phage/plasmid primase-like protien